MNVYTEYEYLSWKGSVYLTSKKVLYSHQSMPKKFTNTMKWASYTCKTTWELAFQAQGMAIKLPWLTQLFSRGEGVGSRLEKHFLCLIRYCVRCMRGVCFRCKRVVGCGCKKGVRRCTKGVLKVGCTRGGGYTPLLLLSHSSPTPLPLLSYYPPHPTSPKHL